MSDTVINKIKLGDIVRIKEQYLGTGDIPNQEYIVNHIIDNRNLQFSIEDKCDYLIEISSIDEFYGSIDTYIDPEKVDIIEYDRFVFTVETNTNNSTLYSTYKVLEDYTDLTKNTYLNIKYGGSTSDHIAFIDCRGKSVYINQHFFKENIGKIFEKNETSGTKLVLKDKDSGKLYCDSGFDERFSTLSLLPIFTYKIQNVGIPYMYLPSILYSIISLRINVDKIEILTIKDFINNTRTESEIYDKMVKYFVKSVKRNTLHYGFLNFSGFHMLDRSYNKVMKLKFDNMSKDILVDLQNNSKPFNYVVSENSNHTNETVYLFFKDKKDMTHFLMHYKEKAIINSYVDLDEYMEACHEMFQFSPSVFM